MHLVKLIIAWEKIFTCCLDLHIKTETVGYNNKILISDNKFNLGKNDKVNALVLEPVISKEAMPSYKVVAQPTHAHELAQKSTITHEEEKIALILFLTDGFAMWFMFR